MNFFFRLASSFVLISRDVTNVPESAAIVSKSCEDLTRDDEEDNQIINKKPKQQKSSSKKFAFQSTIRQIERKKIAEKLSKEAEFKGMRFNFFIDLKKYDTTS